MTPLLLLAELAGLLFLSRLLIQKLYLFFLMIFRARSVAISAVTLLLFPGTVIHELSHLFTAEILGVRTGKLTLSPESLRETNIKTGSVAIAATGPFRRATIGLAPIAAGLLAIAALSYFLPEALPDWTNLTHLSYWNKPSAYLFLLITYLLFSVSNTMFSSYEDLRGFWPLAITISLFVAAAYAVGFRIGLAGQAAEVAQRIMAALVQSLGLVLAVNGILLLTLHVLAVLTRKLPG